ncbi:hypothetical protein AMAG_03264 [Allomyces macrogynus ATCC 38327]|uniref:C2H2-type domain-containing protein n=1 Tax=Allomyces macrogynus (strain ATCC 38327) TaxID=578462 RepID=A0A0L0S5D2_ALLM3|nr:hypothetical protein AMAG_03264 [Allomyces macrogynus ATCC 38327]|eukprot:KNE57569.1 hypothetical protein AMAG_03264 [Allomyces macrogynus ATCC 38327]
MDAVRHAHPFCHRLAVDAGPTWAVFPDTCDDARIAINGDSMDDLTAAPAGYGPAASTSPLDPQQQSQPQQPGEHALVASATGLAFVTRPPSTTSSTASAFSATLAAASNPLELLAVTSEHLLSGTVDPSQSWPWPTDSLPVLTTHSSLDLVPTTVSTGDGTSLDSAGGGARWASRTPSMRPPSFADWADPAHPAPQAPPNHSGAPPATDLLGRPRGPTASDSVESVLSHTSAPRVPPLSPDDLLEPSADTPDPLFALEGSAPPAMSPPPPAVPVRVTQAYQAARNAAVAVLAGRDALSPQEGLWGMPPGIDQQQQPQQHVTMHPLQMPPQGFAAYRHLAVSPPPQQPAASCPMSHDPRYATTGDMLGSPPDMSAWATRAYAWPAPNQVPAPSLPTHYPYVPAPVGPGIMTTQPFCPHTPLAPLGPPPGCAKTIPAGAALPPRKCQFFRFRTRPPLFSPDFFRPTGLAPAPTCPNTRSSPGSSRTSPTPHPLPLPAPAPARSAARRRAPRTTRRTASATDVGIPPDLAAAGRNAHRCPTCDVTFQRKYDYDRHYRDFHSQAEPFQCPMCPQTFRRKDNWRRHLRTVHRGEEVVATLAAPARGVNASAVGVSTTTVPVVPGGTGRRVTRASAAAGAGATSASDSAHDSRSSTGSSESSEYRPSPHVG